MDVARIAVQRGTAVESAPTKVVGEELIAIRRPPQCTRAALAAGVERQHDVISRLDVGHALPHRFDHARTLVAQDSR